MFDRQGQVVATPHPMGIAGSEGSAVGQLYNPVGVAVHPHTGEVYVVEYSNNRVQVFHPL